MFKFNSNPKIETGVVDNKPFFIVDNFFEDPYSIREFIIKNEPNNLWKENQLPTYNGKFFIDKRLTIYHESVYKFNKFVSSLCGQAPIEPNMFHTNMTTFVDRSFNEYQTKFWWPHIDLGYNALIYLDLQNTSGTNVYKKVLDDNTPPIEHFHTWKNKENFELIHTFESKFNRLVLFDGTTFHGMAVDSDTFFKIPRINIVSFYQN
jgi:hypothetical protein